MKNHNTDRIYNRFYRIPIRILFLFMLSILLLMNCSSKPEEPAAVQAPQEQETTPDQESWDATIFITKDGRKVAEVWAGHILVYNRNRQTVLKDSIHVDFYDREGNHKSVLTAREGVVENQTKNLKAVGNVIVVSDSGIVLETEELHWDNTKQKIVSYVPVKFTTVTDTLIGDSFISDPDLKNYIIRNARGYSRRVIPVEK